MQKLINSIVIVALVSAISLRLEAAEIAHPEDVCTPFFNSLFEKTSYERRTVYCKSAKQFKDWVVFEGYNYARSQTRVIATRISKDYWLVMMNDPNSSLDLWLYSKKTLEQVTYGFTIDTKKVPIYSNDEVSNSFLKAVSNASDIVLEYRFDKYNVSHKGSGAAIRYLIQVDPGKSRWKTWVN